MAEDDIYGSKKRYENFVTNIKRILETPKGKIKYCCKNPKNLVYFNEMCKYFEIKDISYVRRLKVLNVLKMITFVIQKNLKDCNRDDINEFVAFMHKSSKTISSKKSNLKDLKCMWRILFPEKDEKGRADETIVPYVVRHLSGKVDKSKEKMRNEKYTIEEFEKILKYFDGETKIQAFITAMQETYARPQELLYLRLRNFEFFDNYGIAYVSEHGKEGTKMIQFESLSYPYILKWYKTHPFKKDPNAFFFIVESNNGKYTQLTNENINFRLKKACRDLKIDKRITCYSLKRMGITIDRMNGIPDKIIIAKAGWTSAKQLSVYDLGTRSEALRVSLIRQGLVKPRDENEKKFVPLQKVCAFCGVVNAHTDELCDGCHRPLDREKIQKIMAEQELLTQNALIQRLAQLEIEIKSMKKS